MLSDLDIKNAKPGPRRYRVSDGGSLYLVVHPSGARTWLFRYKSQKKLRSITLGRYPMLGLRAARLERDRKRVELASGKDPLNQKQITRMREAEELAELKTKRAQRRTDKEREAVTFERVALEWIKRRKWSDGGVLARQQLTAHAFPLLGKKPIEAIRPTHVLTVLDALLQADKLELARKVKQRLVGIFEYAHLRYELASDPMPAIRESFSKDLRNRRAALPVKPMACIAAAEVPAFLRALRAYRGPAGVLTRFIMLTACRTVEARGATWNEFALEHATWTIPKERMKARSAHTVYLSRQTVELVRELEKTNGNRSASFLFPHPRKRERCASENAVLSVLAAIDYKDRMTGHGFRSLFSTLANESESPHFRSDVIEISLAHGDEDKVRAAYNRAKYEQERRRLMQWYADELERLEQGESAKVIALHA